MAWTPISNTVPQYEEDGVAASGFYIKFYEAGTTTPTAMATDSTGATTLDKCELNTEGYPKNGSNAVFIPHIDRRYKIALFRNATDADNNNLNNAVWPVDNMEPVLTEGSGEVATVSDLRSVEPTKDGQQISLLGHTLPGLGGGTFYFDESDTTSADNNGTIIVTTEGKRWKRPNIETIFLSMFGGIPDGVTDSTAEAQAAEDFVSTSEVTNKLVYDGNFAVQTLRPRSNVNHYGGTLTGLNSRLFLADSDFNTSSWMNVLFVTEVADSAILLVDTPYVTQDITFKDNISVGYAVAVSARATLDLRAIITDNRILDAVTSSNIFWSIYLQSDLTSTQLSIIDGNIIDNVSAGILSADKAAISNNIVDIKDYAGTGSHGIYLSAVDGTTVTGNYVRTKKECIPCNQSNDCTITGNYMETNNINAMRLQESRGINYNNNTVVLDAAGGAAASFVRGFATGVIASTECKISNNKFRIINGTPISNPFVFASLGSTSAWDVSIEDNEFYDVDTSALTGAFFEQAFAKIFDSVQSDEIVFRNNKFKNITHITADFRGREIFFIGCSEFDSVFDFAGGGRIDTGENTGSIWFDIGASGAINDSKINRIITSVTKEAGVGVYKAAFSKLVGLESFNWSSSGTNAPLEITPDINFLSATNPYYTELEFTLRDGARSPFNPNFSCVLLIKIEGIANTFSDIQDQYGLN